MSDPMQQEQGQGQQAQPAYGQSNPASSMDGPLEAAAQSLVAAVAAPGLAGAGMQPGESVANYAAEAADQVLQVVCQSGQNGELVGVSTALVNAPTLMGVADQQQAVHQQQQQQQYLGGNDEFGRPGSTLPSVAEESSSGGGGGAGGLGGSALYLAGATDSSEALGQLAGSGAAGEARALGELADGGSTSRSLSRAADDDFNDQPPDQPGYPYWAQLGPSADGATAPYGAPGGEREATFYERQEAHPMGGYATLGKQQVSRSGSARSFGYEHPLGEPSVVQQQSQAHPQSDTQLQAACERGTIQQPAEPASNPSAGVYENSEAVFAAENAIVQSRVVAKHSPISEEADENNNLTPSSGFINSNNNNNNNGTDSGLVTVHGFDSRAAGANFDDSVGQAENNGDKPTDEADYETDISQILFRNKSGAVESGSFRRGYKKNLANSSSSNEADLSSHREKLRESQEAANQHLEVHPEHQDEPGDLPSKFKRTHSVSFNVGASRAGRLSVDIRNLPSYLTVKRASIVDVARGAMTSFLQNFGSGAGSTTSSQRRDSSSDDEPIFEEPIAPTLSLGQRVALVGKMGAEFGTVGWIGQLPDVDDDWMVGVIFDNMIGNSDGAYNGVRYFYSRENYALFVPLSTLTKTDNYIGRPETGTMLSRMSVSLKPGQMISIQRSSIRLQHCFLNAPHQRVGHDVRAVSNRLHCQCHNCGPCAHLTKQSRPSAIPTYASHHLPPKKHSLAHAAVELLTHHHHHFHEEEEVHEEEDREFGENAAHACNFVRYSCCQQSGRCGHDFTADCSMVRPELLDNLIHAPRAPHRRSRPRRRRPRPAPKKEPLFPIGPAQQPAIALTNQPTENTSNQLAAKPTEQSNFSTLDTVHTESSRRSEWIETNTTVGTEPERGEYGIEDGRSGASSRSCSTCSSRRSRSANEQRQAHESYDYYGTTTTTTAYQQQGNGEFSTIDTQVSLMDQQRYIYQRDSTAFVRSRPYNASEDDADSEYWSSRGGFIKRCWSCLTGRRPSRKSKRPRKRKLSARDKLIEYRRRQSTFVPSTLAKPHEDFATHGIILPNAPGAMSTMNRSLSNSDCSSYSRSNCSSPSHSPRPDGAGAAIRTNTSNELGGFPPQQGLTMQHHQTQANPIEQLKSSAASAQRSDRQLDYDDFEFSDGYGSYKKNGHSYDSAMTDLGFNDTMTNSSNDTLKNLVNQEVDELEPLESRHDSYIGAISPVTTGNLYSEPIEVSSPTASVEDHPPAEDDDWRDSENQVCKNLDDLHLDQGKPSE